LLGGGVKYIPRLASKWSSSKREKRKRNWKFDPALEGKEPTILLPTLGTDNKKKLETQAGVRIDLQKSERVFYTPQ
jgi:hypothetical protein